MSHLCRDLATRRTLSLHPSSSLSSPHKAHLLTMPTLAQSVKKLLPGSAVYPDDRTYTVDRYFTGAVGADTLLAQAKKELAKLGFKKTNSIPFVNLCRDEATDGLKARIDKKFGNSFNTNGLGGVLTCGVTGIKAGASHSPIKASKERYIFFSFPHIAVDPNGDLGSIQRPGREACSSACGALKAALGHFQGVGVSGQAGGAQIDPMDLEFSILLARLQECMAADNVSDADVQGWTLSDMTMLAEKVITRDLETLISKAIDTTKSDYAVIAGVQIHSWPLTVGKGPPLDYLWPKAAYAVVNGERRELRLKQKTATA